MDSVFKQFEHIVRKASQYTEESVGDYNQHPFEINNIYPGLPPKVKQLFDDGHFSEATFAAFKFLEKLIKNTSQLKKFGESLMMEAFNENNPIIKINSLITDSDKDEQRGYKHMFAGGIAGIRNPRGHEYDLEDSPDMCLTYLNFVTMLLKKLEQFSIQKSIN